MTTDIMLYTVIFVIVVSFLIAAIQTKTGRHIIKLLFREILCVMGIHSAEWLYLKFRCPNVHRTCEHCGKYEVKVWWKVR